MWGPGYLRSAKRPKPPHPSTPQRSIAYRKSIGFRPTPRSTKVYGLDATLLGCIVRRSVNRNFTKPGAFRPVTPPSSFEQIVKELKISPGEYSTSRELKEWVRRNKDERYVPPELLKAF